MPAGYSKQAIQQVGFSSDSVGRDRRQTMAGKAVRGILEWVMVDWEADEV